jgi:ribonuclease HII
MLPYILENLAENDVLVGCDEVGRGPGSGPVVAACVIWSKDYIPNSSEEEKMLDLVKDSKKVSAKNRERLTKFIKENALDYGIGIIDNNEIDRINILNATYKAMHLALDELKIGFDRICVDGNRFKTYMDKNGNFIPHTSIVNGDNKLFQIAAASIIAKTYRDNLMLELHNSNEKLQVYGWDKNKGYLTKQHINAIKEHGLTQYHRKSFIHV